MYDVEWLHTRLRVLADDYHRAEKEVRAGQVNRMPEVADQVMRLVPNLIQVLEAHLRMVEEAPAAPKKSGDQGYTLPDQLDRIETQLAEVLSNQAAWWAHWGGAPIPFDKNGFDYAEYAEKLKREKTDG